MVLRRVFCWCWHGRVRRTNSRSATAAKAATSNLTVAVTNRNGASVWRTALFAPGENDRC